MDYGVNFDDKPCASFTSNGIFYELPFLWTAFSRVFIQFYFKGLVTSPLLCPLLETRLTFFPKISIPMT